MVEKSPSKGLVHRLVRCDEGVLLLSLQGHLRMAEAGAFNEVIDLIESHMRPRVALDLSGLNYMDSTGLSGLTRLHWHLTRAKSELVLLDPPEPILSVLRMARLDQLFGILRGMDADALRVAT